jgi:hypothetical protein
MLNKINISPERQKLIVYLVLTIVTFAVYLQLNQSDFINLDDNIYVTQNSHIQPGITLEGIRWAFSTYYAEFWHPLTLLSLILDYQLYGLNPGGYHLTNLILHILSTLLLFWLFTRMTGAIWKSAFVAALFSLHPLHVESVAWIAERKDVLSAFFWMLTLCLYVCYTEKPVIRRYLPVLLCFACALMSKPMVVTLPVIMILLDYWPLKRFESQKSNLFLWQMKEKTPFFVFSTFFVIITRIAQPNTKTMMFPLSSRLANATVSFVTYLEKTFWPHNLAVFYPFPEQIPLWQVLGAVLLIIIISVAVIVMAKRLPYLFAGWLWYSITILPVIGIIQVGIHGMADRYTYLPSVGIGVMLAWGIPSLIKNEEIRNKLLFPAALAFLTIMSVLTWQQCGYWKNSIELFNHTVQVTKNNHKAYKQLGYAYGMIGQYQQAIDNYSEAIRLKPVDLMAYTGRGIAYIYLGQYQSAIEDFNKALKLQPIYTSGYNYRGKAYNYLGQYQQAIKDYSNAIRLKPNYADAYNNRGIAYFNQGNNEIGCSDAQKACARGVCEALEMAKSKGYCR